MTLPWRLLFFAVLPLLGAVCVGGWLVLGSLEGEFEHRLQENVEMVARALQRPVSRALQFGETTSIEEALASARRIGHVYGAYLYDEEGNLVASVGRTHDKSEEARVVAVLDEGRRTGEYGDVGGRPVYSYFVPLSDDAGRNLGLLQITRRKRDFREFFSRLRMRAVAIVGAGAGVMTVIVLLGYHGAVGRALSRLRESMRRVENGERAHRAVVDGPREVGALAHTLNDMLDSMERTQEAIRRERETRAAIEKRLQQSEKLAAIGQLAAGVAHELGTPLSIIDGRAQRALRDPTLTERVRLSLEEARGEVRRMTHIVRQLLDFARPSAGTRHPMSPYHVLVDATCVLREEAERRQVRVTALTGKDSGWVVEANAARVSQALVNLVRNAIQAARSQVAVGWRGDARGITFVVDDDGPGVAVGVRPRLFEPFFTTRSVDEGTGLGLAIAYSVAEEHGGGLDVGTSELGGARFELHLPSKG